MRRLTALLLFALLALGVVIAPAEAAPSVSEVRFSNATDQELTISWLTSSATTGSVRYGTSPQALSHTAHDVRGPATRSTLHYVTLTHLRADTTYYFDLVVEGRPVTPPLTRFTTGRAFSPSAPDETSAYGQILADGRAVNDAIVFVTLRDSATATTSQPLSALVRAGEDGFWLLPPFNARTSDGQRYLVVGAEDWLDVEAIAEAGQHRTTLHLRDARPAPALDVITQRATAPAKRPATARPAPATGSLVGQIALDAGWTFAALPVAPASSLNASDACRDLSDLQEVARWHGSRWYSHRCGTPAGDFRLEVGQGYFFASARASTWQVAGSALLDDIALDLQPQWNALAVPFNTGYSAADLCAQLDDQGATATEALRWTGNRWNSYRCGSGTGSFALEATRGVMVQIESGQSFRLPYLPSDARVLYWSHERPANASHRTVLLRWRAATVGQTHSVERRPVGSTGAWSVVGSAAPAPDPHGMRNLLDLEPGLFQALAHDLRPAGQSAPLSASQLFAWLFDPAHRTESVLLGMRHYPVALVMGDAFRDTQATLTTAWEYRVTSASGLSYGPVVARSPRAPLAYALAVQERFPGPDELGRPDSARPLNAAERYDWTIVEDLMPHHGRVFLTWALPPETTSAGQTPNYHLHEVAGYHVYRRGSATAEQWQLANPRRATERCQSAPLTTDPTCILLVSTSSDATAESATPTRFDDDLITLFPVDPPRAAMLFNESWDYRVCPVDWLGNELTDLCDETTLPVRDLDRPAPVSDLSVTPNTAHDQLTIAFGYQDPAELSPPVTLRVMRSLTPTLGSEGWEEIAVLSDINPRQASQHQIIDSAPQGTTYWYHVEVRDNAGNWAAQGSMRAGTLFPREAPPLASIPHDAQQCATNPHPLTLDNLDPALRLMRVYRTFEASAPFPGDDWVLLGTFPIENGRFVLEDGYQPPVRTDAYYRLEALDGHGNLSGPVAYCTALETDRLPSTPPPPNATPQRTDDEDSYDLEISLPSAALDPVVEEVGLVVVYPNGPDTYTETIPLGDGPSGDDPVPTSYVHELDLPLGVPVQLYTIVTGTNGVVLSSPYLVWETNNFLDTERQMTNLGPLTHAEWAGPYGADVAELFFPYNCDAGTPPPVCRPDYWVALFRQGGGSDQWMQVTAVRPVTDFGLLGPGHSSQTPVITDTADLDPADSYRYTALAFSPHTFEVLGYWEPTTLAPRVAAPPPLELATLAPAPTFPQACGSYISRAAPMWNLPGTLQLPNGWYLSNLSIFTHEAGDPGCPIGATPDAGHLYGIGHLQGDAARTVRFFDIAIHPTQGTLTGGRIVADFNETIPSGAQGLERQVHQVEWTASGARAAMTLTLPRHIKLTANPDLGPLSPRYRRVTAVWEGYAPDGSAPPLVDAQTSLLHIVDERLPWRLVNYGGFTLGLDGLALTGLTESVDRLRYDPTEFWPLGCGGGPECSVPDNNLAFLRAPYQALDPVTITHGGLTGSFTTSAPLRYSTSLPANFRVYTWGGATVELSDSRLTGGEIRMADDPANPDATAHILAYYDDQGRAMDSINPQTGRFVPAYTRDGLTLAPDNERRYDRHATFTGAATLPLLPGGAISTPMQATVGLHWPNFAMASESLPGGGHSLQGTFVAVAPLFSDLDPAQRQEPDAPMVAELAWAQQPAPFGEVEPGFNVNTDDGAVQWLCYAPPDFPSGVKLDMYLRRGGMSESLELDIENNPPLRTNVTTGYSEVPTAFRARFLDNLIDPDPPTTILTRLWLPYPTDKILDLQVTSLDSNCPAGGSILSQSKALHDYWNFSLEFDPQAAAHRFRYVEGREEFYAAHATDPNFDLPGSEDKVLELVGRGTINGLGTTPSSPETSLGTTVRSEWLPDGDFGAAELLMTAHQMDSFHVSGLSYAPRATLTLSRFHSSVLDANSLPVQPVLDERSLQSLHPDLLLTGTLSPESLRLCAESFDPNDQGLGEGVGCGFVLLDGEGYTMPFGALAQESAAGFTGWIPRGGWPVAISDRGLWVGTSAGGRTFSLITPTALTWRWAVGGSTMSLNLPVAFMGNSSGGAVMGLLHDAHLLPGMDVLVMDVALIATARWDAGGFHHDRFGIFLGHAAPQAIFRALAQHRPPADGSPGVRPYARWDDVSGDLLGWASAFGYAYDGSRVNCNDAVDLAYRLWEGDTPGLPACHPTGSARWDARGFHETFAVTEPLLATYPVGGTLPYGGDGIAAGSLLSLAGTTLERGLGQAAFFPQGGSYGIESLGLASRLEMDANTTLFDDSARLLHIEWVRLSYSRDGVLDVSGTGIRAKVTGVEDTLNGQVYLRFGFATGEERFEGSVFLYDVKTFLVTFPALGLALGAGNYHGEPIFYVGGHADAVWLNKALTGALLFGNIYKDNPVLRNANFGLLLDKLPDSGEPATTFDGFYVALGGPLFSEGGSCLAEVGAYGEFQLWYFAAPGITSAYGGTLRAAAHASVLCLFSARGDLTLTAEQIGQGSSSGTPTQTCTSERCAMISGEFWVAAGVGFCSPGTWHRWPSRWWGDSWCWSLGAVLDVSYLYDFPADDGNWAFDVGADLE